MVPLLPNRGFPSVLPGLLPAAGGTPALGFPVVVLGLPTPPVIVLPVVPPPIVPPLAVPPVVTPDDAPPVVELPVELPAAVPGCPI